VILDDAFHFLKKYNIKGNHETVECPPSSTLRVVNNNNNILDSGFSINPGIPWLLTLSAHNKVGLKRLADAYAAYFESSAISRQPFHNFMANLSYTLNVRRSALPFKSFFLAADLAGLQSVRDQTSVVYQALKKPTLAFVFTGQGAQWLGMGRQLAHFPIFQQSITKCGEYLQDLGCSWSLTGRIIPFVGEIIHNH
jgi:acyl transferase domain-containing protein